MTDPKILGTLKITFTVLCDVYDLSRYDAKTIEEAAKNQQHWFDEGSADPHDFLEDASVITTVEVAKEQGEGP